MIEVVENSILKAVDAQLPGKLNGLGSLPGPLTEAMIKRAIQYAPAVYVAFVGGPEKPMGRSATFAGKFELYAITHGGIEPDRRRNDAISAYAVLEAVVPVVHQLQVPGVGSLAARALRNLYTDKLLDIDCSVYAVDLDVDLTFVPDAVVADDFLTFHADYDIETFTAAHYPVWLSGDRTTPEAPDAQDTVTLEGP